MSGLALKFLDNAIKEMNEEFIASLPEMDRPFCPKVQKPICLRCLKPFDDQIHGPVEKCTEHGCDGAKAHHVPNMETPQEWMARVQCASRNDGFPCTKPKGHQGEHIAHGLGMICARW